MTSHLKTALAALLATAVATGALAQASNSENPGVSAGATTDLSAAASGMNAEAGAKFTTYGDVISSLNRNGSTDMTDPFAEVDAETDITFVRLSELQGEGAENAQALDTALQRSMDRIDTIRQRIEENGTLDAALSDAGVSADQVVAWNHATDGSVVLVIDDRT